MGEIDSGFMVLFDDAPDPEEIDRYEDPRDAPGINWICLHCLIEDHPELGRGLDIAREHGWADLEAGEWVARVEA